jgi:hypothetical protein
MEITFEDYNKKIDDRINKTIFGLVDWLLSDYSTIRAIIRDFIINNKDWELTDISKERNNCIDSANTIRYKEQSEDEKAECITKIYDILLNIYDNKHSTKKDLIVAIDHLCQDIQELFLLYLKNYKDQLDEKYEDIIKDTAKMKLALERWFIKMQEEDRARDRIIGYR